MFGLKGSLSKKKVFECCNNVLGFLSFSIDVRGGRALKILNLLKIIIILIWINAKLRRECSKCLISQKE
jgi:hypothetical protein